MQVEPAYAAIAAFQEGGLKGHPSVKEMLEEAAGLREHQELFEITVSEFLPLTRCQVCPPGCLSGCRKRVSWRVRYRLPSST